MSLELALNLTLNIVKQGRINGQDPNRLRTRQEVGCGGSEKLRWMSGVTKLDRILTERNGWTTKVEEISKKVG